MNAPSSICGTLLRHAGAGGSLLDVPLDRALLSGTLGPAALLALRDRGRPWSAENLILSLDFHTPQVESRVPRARALCREIVEAFGLRHVFELNAGIGTVAATEWGLLRPGQVVAGSGRCTAILGGVGAVGLRLDEPALVEALLSGAVRLPAPRIAGVRVVGRLPRHLGAWDLARAVIETLPGGPSGTVIECFGETRQFPLGLRLALCGLLGEMGAVSALVVPDASVEMWYRERGIDAPLPAARSGADFDVVVDLTVDRLAAVAAGTYAGPASRIEGSPETAVHGVFIGSCYGGYLEDLGLAAEILRKGGRVHRDVRLTLSPASLEVARAALHAGYYETFLQAGAMVTVPGVSAGSVGGGAILGQGERLASTTEYHRNVEPAAGRPDVTVLSSAAAAAAAVAGRLVDPATYLA